MLDVLSSTETVPHVNWGSISCQNEATSVNEQKKIRMAHCLRKYLHTISIVEDSEPAVRMKATRSIRLVLGSTKLKYIGVQFLEEVPPQ